MVSEEYVRSLIKEEGEYATNLLISKNIKYGNSAVCPVRFFSKADPVEQIKVRIDDKLNRAINSGQFVEDEDVILDLIGYLILLRVAKRVHAVQTDSLSEG